MTHLKEMGEIQCCKSLQLFINLSTISFVQNGFQFFGKSNIALLRVIAVLEKTGAPATRSHLTVIIFPNSTNFPLSQDFSHHCTCDSHGMALDKLISNLQITYWITLDDVKSEYSNVIY